MSPNLSREVKMEVLSRYMNTLRISGYDEAYRHQIAKGVLERINQTELQIADGTRMRYRSRMEIDDQKLVRMRNYPDTWFLGGNHTGILKVQNTPKSKLIDSIRSRLKNVKGPKNGEL